MTPELNFAFLLFSLFHIKHYVCDFPLQFTYMIIKKCSPDWDFFIPLMQHAGIHALFTLGIVLVFNPRLWWLGLLDLVIHFFVDRLKSGPKYFGRYNDGTKPIFWSILGFDQMVHHLTHVYIAYVILNNTAAPSFLH